MRKKDGTVTSNVGPNCPELKLPPEPIPMATIWFFEPKDGYTIRAMRDKLEEYRYSPRTLCGDGEPHDLWSVTLMERDAIIRLRKTEDKLHFSVWYKSKTTKEIEKWMDDKTFVQRNPSLFPNRRRKFKGLIITGTGKPAGVPRRRKQPRNSTDLPCGDWEYGLARLPPKVEPPLKKE